MMSMFTLLLVASLAWADAVDMPPDNCPTGAEGTSSHSGTWCIPTECSSDDECSDTPCSEQEIGLCVETEEDVSCGGWMPDTGEPCTFTRRTAHGTCTEQSDCAVGTCEFDRRCANSIASRCAGCSSSPSGWAGALLGGLITLIAVRLR